MTHHKAKSGHLYVIATQSGLVKFGISINPKNRLKQHALTFGAVSPIVDSWVSPAFIQYKEAEKFLISKYGGERVAGIPFWDVLCDAQLAYEDFSQLYEVALDSAYTSSNGESGGLPTPSQSMARVNFLISNTDEDLTAYFMVPVICEMLKVPHKGMPNEVRDNIANKLSNPDPKVIAGILSGLSAGGAYADFALGSVGLSKSSFHFEAAI